MAEPAVPKEISLESVSKNLKGVRQDIKKSETDIAMIKQLSKDYLNPVVAEVARLLTAESSRLEQLKRKEKEYEADSVSLQKSAATKAAKEIEKRLEDLSKGSDAKHDPLLWVDPTMWGALPQYDV